MDMKAREEDDAMVFRVPAHHKQPGVATVVAMALWLGAIHFNVVLIMASLFLFSCRIALLVLGTQVLFMFVPVNPTNKWGRSIARFICKHTVSYFPITLHVEHYDAFDPNRSYVFGYEPHSIVPFGAWVLTDLVGFMPLPNMKILTNRTVLCFPFMRQIWTWLGSVPASREISCAYLGAGYSCVVSPGGLQETLYMDHGSEVAFIRQRKGFVRIAMQNGCPLVPVFCFGQSATYKWWNPKIKLLTKIARAMKSLPVIFWGKFGTPIPFALPLHVFVGKPIEVEKKDRPTIDEVNDVHEQFVFALHELFERHKAKAGYPDVYLRII